MTVYLRGGTYQQTSTLTFANADSGTGGFYVKYMAYQGERPLITGGKPITGLEGLRCRQEHLLGGCWNDAVPTALRQWGQGRPRPYS